MFEISPPCVNGVCTEDDDGSSNFCICQMGWKGQSCDQCVPHWNCPVQDQTACIGRFHTKTNQFLSGYWKDIFLF